MPARRLATFAAAVATAATIVVVALIWGQPEAARTEAEPISAPGPAPADGTWAAAAAALPLIERSTVPRGYDSASFGEPWADIDGNGCAQDDDVLARDLSDAVREDCAVVSGTLRDPYAGRTIRITDDRVDASGGSGAGGIRVDHLVSLRAAHDGGAWEWSPERRLQFANSLENLVAVDAASAENRDDRGPGRWMPSDEDYACEYAIRYTWIVTAWQLAVTPADRDALTSALVACGR
jgi:hypothetical protein